MKTIILLLTVTTQLFAQLPTKLEALKSKRDAAIENINQIYKQELQKLLADKTLTIDEKKKIEIELNGPLPENVDSFLGIKWKSSFGTEYTFNENKTGSMNKGGKLTTFKWTKRDGIIYTDTEPVYFFVFENPGGV